MSRALYSTFLLALIPPALGTTPPTLDSLRAQAPGEDADPFAVARFHEDVIGLVDANTLTTGPQFLQAANLCILGMPDFRANQAYYELLLVAVAKDDKEAEDSLAPAWDQFLSTLGRPVRLGTLQADPGFDGFITAEPAPACISSVFKSPQKARARAAKTKDNSELKQIVDADQAVRMKNWNHLSSSDMQAIAKKDEERARRTRQIVEAGQLHTASDFQSASLVLQHGENFASYEEAHELAVCSLLLGDRSTGMWLVAATYDRMLGSIGFGQRFGTQYGQAGLMPVDEQGICNNERLAMGCRNLQASMGNSYIDHAQDLNASGKYAQAEPFARDGLALRQAGYPPGSWEIFAAKAALGNSLRGQKKFKEAGPLLDEAYAGLSERMDKIPIPYQVRLRECMEALEQLCEATNQSPEAGQWRLKVKDFDRSHPNAN